MRAAEAAAAAARRTSLPSASHVHDTLGSVMARRSARKGDMPARCTARLPAYSWQACASAHHLRVGRAAEGCQAVRRKPDPGGAADCKDPQ